jgi:predicted membrane-bound spermidine synthase
MKKILSILIVLLISSCSVTRINPKRSVQNEFLVIHYDQRGYARILIKGYYGEQRMYFDVKLDYEPVVGTNLKLKP